MGEGPQRQVLAQLIPFISFAPPTRGPQDDKFFGCGKRLSNEIPLLLFFPPGTLTPLSSEEKWTSVRTLGHPQPVHAGRRRIAIHCTRLLPSKRTRLPRFGPRFHASHPRPCFFRLRGKSPPRARKA